MNYSTVLERSCQITRRIYHGQLLLTASLKPLVQQFKFSLLSTTNNGTTNIISLSPL